jgi:hypothetical protein
MASTIDESIEARMPHFTPKEFTQSVLEVLAAASCENSNPIRADLIPILIQCDRVV